MWDSLGHLTAAKKEEGGEKKTFKPPKGVQSAARHALELIEKGKAGDGFTGVGRGRAHQLANGEAVSMTVIKKMHSYFSRHAVDKKGKDWDNDSPGKVAWLAWGGDAGRAWVNGIMRDHGDKDKESQKKEGSAWPSDAHYEEHLDDLEELLHDTLKGVDWHTKRGDHAEAEKHMVLADNLKKAIESARALEGYNSNDGMQVSASAKTANQYIEKQGDKWVITQKGTGKVLSHHDTKEKADAAFAAMMAHKHGSSYGYGDTVIVKHPVTGIPTAYYVPKVDYAEAERASRGGGVEYAAAGSPPGSPPPPPPPGGGGGNNNPPGDDDGHPNNPSDDGKNNNYHNKLWQGYFHTKPSNNMWVNDHSNIHPDW